MQVVNNVLYGVRAVLLKIGFKTNIYFYHILLNMISGFLFCEHFLTSFVLLRFLRWGLGYLFGLFFRLFRFIWLSFFIIWWFVLFKLFFRFNYLIVILGRFCSHRLTFPCSLLIFLYFLFAFKILIVFFIIFFFLNFNFKFFIRGYCSGSYLS